MENWGSGFWGEVAADTIDFSRIANRCGTFSKARNILLPPLPFIYAFSNKIYLVSEEKETFQEQ